MSNTCCRSFPASNKVDEIVQSGLSRRRQLHPRKHFPANQSGQFQTLPSCITPSDNSWRLPPGMPIVVLLIFAQCIDARPPFGPATITSHDSGSVHHLPVCSKFSHRQVSYEYDIPPLVQREFGDRDKVGARSSGNW